MLECKYINIQNEKNIFLVENLNFRIERNSNENNFIEKVVLESLPYLNIYVVLSKILLLIQVISL